MRNTLYTLLSTRKAWVDLDAERMDALMAARALKKAEAPTPDQSADVLIAQVVLTYRMDNLFSLYSYVHDVPWYRRQELWLGVGLGFGAAVGLCVVALLVLLLAWGAPTAWSP